VPSASRRKKRRKLPAKLVWGIAGAITVVTWAYGFWIGIAPGLISIPIGLAAGLCAMGAFKLPWATTILVIAFGLSGIDGGPDQVLARAAVAFLAVGFLGGAIQSLQYAVLKGWLR
jgi:hypothetical protein